MGRNRGREGLTQRVQRIVDTLRSTPGVEAAATAGTLPGVPGKYETELKLLEGEIDPAHNIVVESRYVSPGLFRHDENSAAERRLCREDPKP